MSTSQPNKVRNLKTALDLALTHLLRLGPRDSLAVSSELLSIACIYAAPASRAALDLIVEGLGRTREEAGLTSPDLNDEDCLGLALELALTRLAAMPTSDLTATSPAFMAMTSVLLDLETDPLMKIINQALSVDLPELDAPSELTVLLGDPVTDARRKIEARMGNSLECSDLDDMVHDAAATQASEINNAGVDSQIAFLLAQGSTVQDLLESLDLADEPEDSPAL